MIQNDIKLEKVNIVVEMDRIDQALLSFFRKYPHRSYRIHEIFSILRYDGIEASFMQIVNRLHDLCVLGYIRKEKLGRTNIYFYKS